MQKTKYTISTSEPVEDVLNIVQKKLLSISESESKHSNYITQYLIFRGGKRLRPLLVTLSSLEQADVDDIANIGAAAELIHTASLVHDDIVDDSKLRRGVQTINSKWNNSVAVLVGDFLFAKAFEILGQYKDRNIIDQYTGAISMMSIGELEQLKNRYNHRKSISQYYKEIRGKTGKLISVCCKSGAMLAEMQETDIEQIENYGLEVGYAFQIIDDMLDITGSPSSLGKPVFKDLVEGNITLPMILLLEHSNQRSLLEEIIITRDFSDVNMKLIYKAMGDNQIPEIIFEIAKEHIANALASLENTSNFYGKDRYKTLAEFVLKRKK
ncbi:polyprenyl synthetase family protein [Alkalicella caledoniensis]|uniref:Polyprenyl synthetase family protein n=1 Tax=Alkalicella caledoniensis TaxID=2731377 RepID=A0A7G9WC49_ALKCA|nr:polyprenyl synthetase family protein [Alkalicella caledoniensis]QNO16261.1 polyprenyl synthetase family protein [Alkalicella caledoniensis]